jgi:peptidoglycan/xylan/chitin deacetylase (PgdA/CDA1 family)
MHAQGARKATPLIALLVALGSFLSVLGCTGSALPESTTTTSSIAITSVDAGSHSVRVPILAYHYVDFSPVPGLFGKRLTIRPGQFREEMNYLVAAGYHSIDLDEAYLAVEGGPAKLPPKPVIITFDDGGLDDYTIAYHILREKNLTATFFVPTSFVGSPRHMLWSQLALMARAGMSIESHTVHHWDLTTLGDAQLARELAASRSAIESHLGVTVRFLAYPGGKYDSRVEAAARAAGYLACVTVRPGTALSRQNELEWPRYGIGPWETLAGFKKALAQ